MESYLFTEEAFADIKRVLRPDGVFVAYNYFRQGWIVERVAAMAESVWGCKPIVLSLPYLETLKSSERAGFTMVVTTCNPAIAEAFKQHGSFWLNSVPPEKHRYRRVHCSTGPAAAGAARQLAQDRADRTRA